MKTSMSTKELRLFSYFNAEHLREDRSISAAYDALVIHAFMTINLSSLSKEDFNAIDSLRRVYDALRSCQFYRETEEFDNLINI